MVRRSFVVLFSVANQRFSGRTAVVPHEALMLQRKAVIHHSTGMSFVLLLDTAAVLLSFDKHDYS